MILLLALFVFYELDLVDGEVFLDKDDFGSGWGVDYFVETMD